MATYGYQPLLENASIQELDTITPKLQSPLDQFVDPEEYWKSQRKCKRCRKLYTEEENQSENSRCFYHPGSYADPDDIKKGTLVGWSCCNQIYEPSSFFNRLNTEALPYDSKGCKEKRFHKEDVEYTISLHNFPFKAPSTNDIVTDDGNNNIVDPIDFKKLESISFTDLKDHPNFIVHNVGITDTLVGVSMKYDIPAGVIQRINRLPTQSIFERKILYIPRTKDNQFLEFPVDDFKLDRDRIKSRFASAMKCTKEEATFYLEEAEWDFSEAIKFFNEDVKWNKDQLLKKGPTLNSPIVQSPKARFC